MKSMTVEFFVARAWRYISLAALLFFLFWVYSGFPDAVAVHFNRQGLGDGFLPRSQFFYIITGLTLISNVLPLLLIKPIQSLPAISFQTFPIRAAWKANIEELVETLGNWFIFLPAIVNTILVFSIKILGKLNDNQYHVTMNDYQWLMNFSLILIVGWFLYLPFKLWVMKP